MALISGRSSAQVFQWAFGIGGPMVLNSYEQGQQVVIDKKTGDVIVSGVFNGANVDFDSGLGVANMSGSTPQMQVSFIAKYMSNGDYVWAIPLEVYGVSSIAVDDSGNIYTVGTFTYTFDFDPGPNIANLTATAPVSPSSYPKDIFIAKYSPNGDYVWAHSIGSAGDLLNGGEDYGGRIAVDRSGNIIVTGRYGSTVDFDPGPGTVNLTADGTYFSTFVAKYDPNGNYIWAKSILNNDDWLGSIVLDSANNIYTAGSFINHIATPPYLTWYPDFDPGPGVFNLTNFQVGVGGSGCCEDIFYAKYDSSFNLVWAKSIGGRAEERINSIDLDASGNIYMAGQFQDTVDFDPGPGTFTLISVPHSGWTFGSQDFYVAKYDNAGNFIWANKFGGAGNESGVMKFDHEKLYATGKFVDTVDFDPGPATANLISLGNDNIFVAAYDTSGAYLWTKGIGSLGNEEFGSALALDSAQNLYVTGAFNGMANFNPGGTAFNVTSNGGSDIFLARYAPICLPQSVQNLQTICQGSFYQINGHEYGVSGTYQDVLQTSVGGCDSIITTVLTVDSVDVSVNVNNATITASASGATYKWIDCVSGSVIAGATSQSYTPVANGDYAVIVTIGTCSDTSICTTITNVGIENPGSSQLEFDFQVYPNPSGGSFSVSLSEVPENALIQVCDASGKVVFSQPVTSMFTDFHTGLAKGVYFIKLTMGSGILRTKKITVI